MTETSAPSVASEQLLAFVIDSDARVHEFAVATLAEHGIRAESFQAAKTALAAIDSAPPAVIFLELTLLQSDAIDVLNGLGERDYRGVVHLISGARVALLDAVRRLGVGKGVTFGAHLTKPVTRHAIVEVITGIGSWSPPLQPAE